MKCPICKHGETKAGASSVTLQRASTTMVFRDVPGEICDNCGEVFHSAEVTAALLQQADAASVEIAVQPLARKSAPVKPGARA